ncbi:hypothetical protein FACS189449_07180 [Alphaproteobacteria bacterium]|nr:hypothetical protein FACS189449_07180 [Alphaproteobacteria bacterium]
MGITLRVTHKYQSPTAAKNVSFVSEPGHGTQTGECGKKQSCRDGLSSVK